MGPSEDVPGTSRAGWEISVYSKKLFLFGIYKMVNNMDICKSLNINIGTVLINQGMLQFVPDHLKTEKNV